jgi:hypothetical protein
MIFGTLWIFLLANVRAKMPGTAEAGAPRGAHA